MMKQYKTFKQKVKDGGWSSTADSLLPKSADGMYSVQQKD